MGYVPDAAETARGGCGSLSRAFPVNKKNQREPRCPQGRKPPGTMRFQGVSDGAGYGNRIIGMGVNAVNGCQQVIAIARLTVVFEKML